MENVSKDKIRKVTSDLRDEMLRERLAIDNEPEFTPVPHQSGYADQSVWRIRFDFSHDSSIRIGLDVNGEVILGREQGLPGSAGIFRGIDTESFGLSRRHAMLRPTDGKLYIVDLGSTNGTWLNGTRLGSNVPYSISNGDHLKLGRLEANFRILKRPVGHSAAIRPQADLSETLPIIAEMIMLQLDPTEVINKTIEMIKWHTPADQVEFWLLDEQTGDLLPGSGRHRDNTTSDHLPLNNVLARQVIESGKPVTINRFGDGELIKIKTGFLVNGVIYVPLTLGGVTFGVLAAAHREHNAVFSKNDEKLLIAVANFAALAIQNARASKVTKHALARRNKVITALNSVLTHDLKGMLKGTIGFTNMLQSDPHLDPETAEIAAELSLTSESMASLVERLIDITKLCDESHMQQEPTDLVEIVQQACDDLQKLASYKSVSLAVQMVGEPYLIWADRTFLYRSVANLLDNAIRFTSRTSEVLISLVFGPSEIVLRVRDQGPGIPEDDLPNIFDKYFRSATANGHGTGLGLEIVQATVENHRGTVAARNADDGGAEFIVTLPATLRIS